MESDFHLVAGIPARLRRSAAMAVAIAPSGARGQSTTNACHRKLPAVDSSAKSGAHDVVTMVLEQSIELLYPLAGQTRLAVRDLSEQGKRVWSEIEHLLALLVQLGAGTVNGCHLRGAVLGQWRRWLTFRPPAVMCLKPSSDDAQLSLVQKQSPCDVGRLRRHGVRDALEHHLCGRAHVDGEA